MPWDAGAIIGKLGLDTSEFVGNLLQAQEIAKLFPDVVQAFLAHPLLGWIDIAEKAGEALGGMFRRVEQDALGMELASERAGTSIGWFSKWAGAAETVGVSADQLGAAFKFLQRSADELVQAQADGEVKAAEKVGKAWENLQNSTNDAQAAKRAEDFKKIAGSAAEAAGGSQALADAYGRLGISTAFLKDHANDAQGLFEAIFNGLQGLNNTTQVGILQTIFGRGGSELIPLLRMSREEVGKLMETQGLLGDVEEESSGKAARAFNTLGVQWHEAWGGIEKALMDPVLDYFAAHADETRGKLIKYSEDVRKGINDAWGWVEGTLFPGAVKLWDWLEGKIGPEAKKLFGEFEVQGKKAWSWTENEAAKGIGIVEGWIGDLKKDLPNIEADLKSIEDEALKVIHAIEGAITAAEKSPLLKKALGVVETAAGNIGGMAKTALAAGDQAIGGTDEQNRATRAGVEHIGLNLIPDMIGLITKWWAGGADAGPAQPQSSEFHAPDSGPAAPDLAPPPTLPAGGSAGQSLAPGIPVKPWQNPLADGSPQASAATIHNYHVGNLTVQVGDSNGMSPEELGRLIHGKVQGVLSAAKAADQWGVVHDNVAEGTGGNA